MDFIKKFKRHCLISSLMNYNANKLRFVSRLRLLGWDLWIVPICPLYTSYRGKNGHPIRLVLSIFSLTVERNDFFTILNFISTGKIYFYCSLYVMFEFRAKIVGSRSQSLCLIPVLYFCHRVSYGMLSSHDCTKFLNHKASLNCF